MEINESQNSDAFSLFLRESFYDSFNLVEPKKMLTVEKGSKAKYNYDYLEYVRMEMASKPTCSSKKVTRYLVGFR
jgi:hypothetical protein